jgi:transposase
MAKTRREFTPQFKREAAALLESSGRPQMKVAAELGIQPDVAAVAGHAEWGVSPAAICWIDGGLATKPGCVPSDQTAEIARLRRELDRTRMERDMLKNV